jgi:hypothetical protein
MGIGLHLSHGSKLHLAGCFEGIFDQKFWSLSAVVVLQNFCSSSLMARRPQNRCCVPALGNCIDCHHSELLGLHLVLPHASTAQAYGSADPQIC